VVVEVLSGGTARVAASCDVGPEIARWSGDADDMYALGSRFVALSSPRFVRSMTLPLVSTGGLFGALILLFSDEGELPSESLDVARAFADLAAIALGRAAQVQKLVRANSELGASREVLARTEKLFALGQMAAGISHDLKNILSPLSLHIQVVQRAVARGDSAKAGEALQECTQILKRGVETVDRLRAFGRQSVEAPPRGLDLNDLAREALGIARARLSSHAAARVEIAEELSPIPAVPGRGGEVLAAIVNLLVNAIDAMPTGGRITIRTMERTDGVALVVADTGPGMAPDVSARVFEPFFTTKGADGTGLGLPMVHATMRSHGGRVTLDTSPGKGAVFTLVFPRRSPGEDPSL
jgi:signal transduction histidine kinase